MKDEHDHKTLDAFPEKKRRKRGKRGGQKTKPVIQRGPEARPEICGVSAVVEMTDGYLYLIDFNKIEYGTLLQLAKSIREDGKLPLTLIGESPKKKGAEAP